MKTLKTLAFAAIAFGTFGSAFAQVPGTRIPPRTDDHFQRWQVVSRIDMMDKINQPLVSTVDQTMYDQTSYRHNQGIVEAIVKGIKDGRFLAYHPDDLTQGMTWQEVCDRDQEINGGTTFEPWPDEDPMEEPLWDDEEWDLETSDSDPFSMTGEEDVFTEESGGSGLCSEDLGTALAPYESVIELIEQRIFDKNRSDMVYNTQYIRIVWVDPGETLPDKNFICVKYSDVIDVLDDTQYVNVHNDAEARSMREVLELRMFDAFVTNVSGRGVRTLPESAYRSSQLTEFEHHLWSY